MVESPGHTDVGFLAYILCLVSNELNGHPRAWARRAISDFQDESSSHSSNWQNNPACLVICDNGLGAKPHEKKNKCPKKLKRTCLRLCDTYFMDVCGLLPFGNPRVGDIPFGIALTPTNRGFPKRHPWLPRCPNPEAQARLRRTRLRGLRSSAKSPSSEKSQARYGQALCSRPPLVPVMFFLLFSAGNRSLGDRLIVQA